MDKHSARAFENLFVDKFANLTLTPQSLQRWNDSRNGHKFTAYPGKRLVVHTLDTIKPPKVVEVFECVSANCDNANGFSSTWHSRQGPDVEVGHAPQEVAEGCFLYSPNNVNIEWLEYHFNKYNLRFTTGYRTRHSADRVHAGVLYISEESLYVDRYGAI